MKLRTLVSVAFQFVLLATLGFAQGVATGDLHVNVRDPKGSVLTNATVTARDETKALERSPVTTVTASTASCCCPLELIPLP